MKINKRYCDWLEEFFKFVCEMFSSLRFLYIIIKFDQLWISKAWKGANLRIKAKQKRVYLIKY